MDVNVFGRGKLKTTVSRKLAIILASLAGVLVILGGLYFITKASAASSQTAKNEHLVTIYDRGNKQVILSKGQTIGDALKQAKIKLDARDNVEPATNTKMIASSYYVNIYRARPVLVVDGATRVKVMTAYQTPDQIAKDAGISLYPEDEATLSQIDSSNVAGSGAGLMMTVKRAIPITLDFYGQITTVRTQATTVGGMLREKKITLTAKDHVVPPLTAPITAGMNVRVWREGKQTITVQEDVPFDTQYIQDGDHAVGWRETRTPGQPGKQTVTYQIDIENGQEVSRDKIAAIVTQAPTTEVVAIGVKSTGGLTKSKGVDFFTDSNGVTHRETYYDLDMSRVTTNCGDGGIYVVRADGVKVDRSGYVLIAADLARYPRCSIVETSVGLGMVYDTGGFVSRYPDGFDIAADWTDYNGR